MKKRVRTRTAMFLIAVLAILCCPGPSSVAEAVTTVTNLSATSPGEATVKLTFECDMTDIDGVVIERRDPDGSSHTHQFEWGTSTTATQLGPSSWRVEWTDSPLSDEMPELAPGNTYYYRVQGWSFGSGAGLTYHTWTNEVSITLMILVIGGPLTPLEPLGAPTNLVATAVSPESINLTWVDNSSSEEWFLVERSTGTSPPVETMVAANSTSYTDTGLQAGTTYTYHVKAYSLALGCGHESNEATATTLGQSTPLVGASSWAIPEIQQAITYGLTTNKVLSDFQKAITREEFCELAVKLYEALAGVPAVPASPNPFTDTSNPDILKAYELGITKGVAPDRFAPGNPISRQEIAVMIVRAIKASNPSLDTTVTGVPQFADEHLIASWAINEVRLCYNYDIMKGTGGLVIDPLANTSREQAIVLMKRTYEKK